jgi:integrase
MPSAWISKHTTTAGEQRYRVAYRIGGRESASRRAGSFRTQREAKTRRDWIAGELAAMRVPDLALLAEPVSAPMLAEAAKRWQESRVDVTENTKLQHRSAIAAATLELGDRRIDTLTPADVVDLVAKLAAKGRKRETIRKTVTALAMCLDHAHVSPNPARDKLEVKLPRGDTPRIVPPNADHLLAVHRVIPSRYRLPLLVLDATGMRLGELEQLAWGDVDEQRGRWLVTAAVSKTSSARWVPVHQAVFEAVLELVPREDRTAERPVFQGFGGDRFRTAIGRACITAGVPTFSPHDLRHRRISLLHLGGVPWARIGEHVGQRNLAVTANTYTHVLTDEAELDYADLLNVSDVTGDAHGVHTPVLHRAAGTLD